VEIVDCTFLTQESALDKIKQSDPRIIGIQSMFSIKNKTLEFAEQLRKNCELLVVGGPLATANPESLLLSRYFEQITSAYG
jgi:radical SAM superfamily enzyme YgiQ (UPF0313 family)